MRPDEIFRAHVFLNKKVHLFVLKRQELKGRQALGIDMRIDLLYNYHRRGFLWEF